MRTTHINPKALSIDHFVGVYDPEVVEWTEGVLSKTVKELTAENSRIQ